mgnify:CR=1 FL=1
MIQSLVRAALQQRLVVVVVAVVLLAFGLNAARKLSVDAFPDVTNVQVQIATEAKGRSPEEVERFVTVPLEISMTGLPGLEEMRSLNKPGLSLITLVFTDATDVYFARQLVMERLLEVGSRMPEGVVPVLGPVSTGLGEVYQYTLDHPDDGDRKLTEKELTERRIVQDWVVRPLLRSIPGVAEINSQGGYARQYQVLVNPDRLRHYQLTVRDVYEAVARNNAFNIVNGEVFRWNWMWPKLAYTWRPSSSGRGADRSSRARRDRSCTPASIARATAAPGSTRWTSR